MKKHFGKIFMLVVAMLVTVPSALVLAACGNKEHQAASAWQMDAENHWHNCQADANDEHQYDLGAHTWQVYNETYTCTVCNYKKTVAGANDQHARVLQTALQNFAKERGSVTANLESKGHNFLGLAALNQGKVSASYDPVKGIGYRTVQSEDSNVVTKIFQNDGRYIEFEFVSEKDAETAVVTEQTNYALVDQRYVYQMLYGEIDHLDVENDATYQLLFHTEWDSTTFATFLLEVLKNRFDTGEDQSIEIDDYRVNYTIQDGLMTVTVLLHGTPTNIPVAIDCDFTGKILLYVDVEHSALVGAEAQAQLAATFNQQRIELQSVGGALNFTFDQTGFDQIKTGVVPDHIQIKTNPAAVIFQLDDSQYRCEIRVPYNATITADNIDDYTAQLQAAIAEAYNVQDPTTIQVIWTNEDFETAFNGNYSAGAVDCLYAKVKL